jgi:hypothetical protein
MQTMICRLRHKTDKRRTALDTHRDLAACFARKRVRLGFPDLPQNWWRSDSRWCTRHHHQACLKMKPKMDGSMRLAASDSSTPTLLFS